MKAIASAPSDASDAQVQVVHGCSGVCLKECHTGGIHGERLCKMAGVYQTWYDAGCISLQLGFA